MYTQHECVCMQLDSALSSPLGGVCGAEMLRGPVLCADLYMLLWKDDAFSVTSLSREREEGTKDAPTSMHPMINLPQHAGKQMK
jgi:hypothetical protein